MSLLDSHRFSSQVIGKRGRGLWLGLELGLQSDDDYP